MQRRLSIWLTLAAVVLSGCGRGPGKSTPTPQTAASDTPAASASRTPLALRSTATASPSPAATATATMLPALTLAPCQLSSISGEAGAAAECGTLTVYEDWAAGSGRQIGLHVAVVRASGATPAADPVFFLAGGPGQAATQSYLAMQAAFADLRDERDIVLVDQRGTGQSNALNCPALGNPLTADDPAALHAAALNCQAQWAADPRFYTTENAVRDLEAVRAALGYARINLYGQSYGTRAAQAYVRRFPQRVRTMILDGVVPPAKVIGLSAAHDAQQALDNIFARCAAEAACHAAFPNPAGDLAQAGARLKNGPRRVTLHFGGLAAPVSFSYNLYATAVWLLSQYAQTAARLPALLHEARARQNYAPLGEAALPLGAGLTTITSAGLTAAVLCSEDAPHITPASAAAANAGSYLGNSQTDPLLEICQDWPMGEAPEDARQPVRADTPTLLLSGGADPLTPPDEAAVVAQDLPNSLSLTARGQGHIVLEVGCLPQVAARFVAAGAVAGLDTTCVDDIEPPAFATRLTP